MPNIHSDSVLGNWMTMIENGAGYGNEIYSEINDELNAAQLSYLIWGVGDYKSSLFGKSRELFVVKHTGFPKYSIFVHARDFGPHLDCGWFLTRDPGMIARLTAKYVFRNPKSVEPHLDVFAQQDLGIWKELIHRTTVRAARNLIGQLKQDANNLNTQAKGYLSVW